MPVNEMDFTVFSIPVLYPFFALNSKIPGKKATSEKGEKTEY